MNSLQKSILVTGCSSGIGYDAAQALKARGYRVFATARKPEDVERLKSLGFEAFCLDLNSSDSIKEAVEQILVSSGGNIYALFNNAGYAQPGALEDLSRELLRQQFETNVFGLQELTNSLIPVMRQQGSGRIIHMSSVLGFISLPYRGAYNASKYAVEGLADTLRLELRDTHIHVSLIEAGPIESQFRNNAIKSFQDIDAKKSYHTEKYRRFLANFAKNQQVKFTQKPQAVIQKLLHALENPRPKIRYYVTFPTYCFVLLKRLLPCSVLDWVLKKISDEEIR